MSGVNPSGATTSGGGSACSGSSSGGGSGSGGSTGPCGACKFLRRKCVSGCIFAPYFDAEQGAGHFAAVHKVFGASNVSKLLMQIPAHRRLDAVVTICYEAQARLRDPVYGCVAHIFALQQQVVNLQAELTYLQAHLATLELPSPPPLPAPPVPNPIMPPQHFSISDLPSATSAGLPHSGVDLSSLFDPSMGPTGGLVGNIGPSQWAPPHQRQQPGSSGGGDLQALARELLDRHRCGSGVSPDPPSSLSK
ncbi:LOB domain protein [Rhynchospora pubera]|uniref:LOB domain protein n=1 Tax=Rhynchospora pubera TaxID=906938 RepID=A0AAV8GU70_9POAL|nr:LOB domain protein [Rhynchospora pubera]KAJ4807151.1 LOB domain protein [Rhynchospora pubera]